MGEQPDFIEMFVRGTDKGRLTFVDMVKAIADFTELPFDGAESLANRIVREHITTLEAEKAELETYIQTNTVRRDVYERCADALKKSEAQRNALQERVDKQQAEIDRLVRTHVAPDHRPGPYTSKYGCGCFYCDEKLLRRQPPCMYVRKTLFGKYRIHFWHVSLTADNKESAQEIAALLNNYFADR